MPPGATTSASPLPASITTRSKRLLRPRSAAAGLRRGASRARCGRPGRSSAGGGAVAGDEVDLVEAAALRRVGDALPVGRPSGAPVVHARRAGQRPDRSGLERATRISLRLRSARGVNRRPPRSRQARPPPRPRRRTPRAPRGRRRAGAAGARSPRRPRAGWCPPARPRSRACPSRSRRGSSPRRACAAGPRRRGRARRGPRLRAAVEPSGDSRGSTSSQYGAGSRPVVSRSGGPPDSRSSSQTSEHSASWMKSARRRSAPIVIERGRGVCATASRRQCGGGFRSLRGCASTPRARLSTWSSARQRFPPRVPRAPRAPVLRSLPVVAALLDDDRRRPVRGAAGGTSVARTQAALRVAGARVHASATTSAWAPLPRPRRELVHGASQPSSPVPGGRQVAVRAAAAVAREAEVVRKPAGAGRRGRGR